MYMYMYIYLCLLYYDSSFWFFFYDLYQFMIYDLESYFYFRLSYKVSRKEVLPKYSF